MAVEFVENTDGSVIIKVSPPVKVNGEMVDRGTIPAITGRHMRTFPVTASEGVDVPIGKFIDFAAKVVSPDGLVDELSGADALSVGTKVAEALGKG